MEAASQVRLAFGLLLLLTPSAHAAWWPALVENERCDVVVEAKRPGDPVFLVLGSLGQADQKYRVRITTAPTSEPASLPQGALPTTTAWKRAVQELGERQALSRKRAAPQPRTLLPPPPPAKVFHVFTRAKDFDNSAHYTAVTADLRAVGVRCQVYVDRADGRPAGLDDTIADVIRTFDEEIHPWAQEHLGRVLDVDRDRRFTILFTRWLGRLQGGKVSIDGFVRASDFCPDLAPPFSNRCDMLYLNSGLRPGPHLRTVLAHEYTHAVACCEHPDEQSWLSEGLAHLAEARRGYGWSNLDYRISAFLSCPENYPLVVADYYGQGLWRTAGTRGSTFLFLRWCHEQFGPDLACRLIQSKLAGTQNVEVATQTPFADLFRRWSVWLLEQPPAHLPWPLGRTASPSHPDGINQEPPPFSRQLSGPRCHDTPVEGHTDVTIAGTGAAYLRLTPQGEGRARVSIRAEPGTNLQVSVVSGRREP